LLSPNRIHAHSCAREPFKRFTDSCSFESAGIFRCLFGGRSRKTCSGCTICAGFCFEIYFDAFEYSVAVKRFRASERTASIACGL
jgi:hypothetical protein